MLIFHSYVSLPEVIRTSGMHWLSAGHKKSHLWSAGPLTVAKCGGLTCAVSSSYCTCIECIFEGYQYVEQTGVAICVRSRLPPPKRGFQSPNDPSRCWNGRLYLDAIFEVDMRQHETTCNLSCKKIHQSEENPPSPAQCFSSPVPRYSPEMSEVPNVRYIMVKRFHNYGKIHHFQWVNPLSIAIFNSKLSV